MGILDGIVEWIAEQVMNILDLITTSVLGALGCSMDTFLRYFPAAETMYQVFLALGIGLILLNWVWQLFKNYFMGAGIEAEDPIKLSIRSFLFIFLTFYAKDIVDLLLKISGTPYNWILTEDLPPQAPSTHQSDKLPLHLRHLKSVHTLSSSLSSLSRFLPS